MKQKRSMFYITISKKRVNIIHYGATPDSRSNTVLFNPGKTFFTTGRCQRSSFLHDLQIGLQVRTIAECCLLARAPNLQHTLTHRYETKPLMCTGRKTPYTTVQHSECVCKHFVFCVLLLCFCFL